MDTQNDIPIWLKDVKGTQVPLIITSDDDTIRVEAGPGTGKTFGLVRRVQRILHPKGLNIAGKKVLVVAFNRVIAKQLTKDIEKCLENSQYNGKPVIHTVHALCLEVIDTELRILLPHEREAMIFDILQMYPGLRDIYGSQPQTDQALRDHEAKISEYVDLWQAAQKWLIRHRARLISDLPGLLLDKLKGGDLNDQTYSYVIVDEYQDLTPGEQQLFLQLREPKGKFMALGDPRQSIYKFRGNDEEGLSKIVGLLAPSENSIKDITMTECQRCPADIVNAANRLMSLSSAQKMTSTSQVSANSHVVVWKSIEAEAQGMANAIVENINQNPQNPTSDNVTHLVMVTRRQFGYRLRDEILKLNNQLKIDLTFSEGLLETWPVREAFLFFCLVVDPDAPTWRAWLAYQNSSNGKKYKAPDRNADAYLQFLTTCKDNIDESAILRLANEAKPPSGAGGAKLLERAKRYADLRTKFTLPDGDALEVLETVFNTALWLVDELSDPETAKRDMESILSKASDIYKEFQNDDLETLVASQLRIIARRLRYQIATSEPFEADEKADLQITTLWGAKGITAEHVYVLGLCKEAIPGSRREEYPGTDLEFEEEQRRLFYVSITRSKKTLVLSRSRYIARNQAGQLGLQVKKGSNYVVELEMSPFLRDIISFLPKANQGEAWNGCTGST